jgi:hypothetical protein
MHACRRLTDHTGALSARCSGWLQADAISRVVLDQVGMAEAVVDLSTRNARHYCGQLHPPTTITASGELSHQSMPIDDRLPAAAVLLSAALAALLAYVLYAVTYNVYLHPLAKFPGPPLAGATTYWKAYVECIANRSFCHFLVELHAQYGERHPVHGTQNAQR